MKRIISHASTIVLSYAIFKGIYGLMYLVLNLAVNKVGMTLLFLYFLFFLWPLVGVMDWVGKKIPMKWWLKTGIFAALGAIGALAGMIFHIIVYHKVNRLAEVGIGYSDEIWFSLLFIFPTLFIAEFLWQYPRKFVLGGQAIIWAILGVFLFFTDTRHPEFPYTAEFSVQHDQGRICSYRMSEASGLAVSPGNPRIMWTHNDFGARNRIYPIGSQGEYGGYVTVEGTDNRDWEDMAIGPGPEKGKSYLYIADIGDNHGIFHEKWIYRIPEPEVTFYDFPINTSVQEVDTIRFRYPNGKRDAETLMFDPKTKDIYIVSKREKYPFVYVLRYPQSTDKINVAKKIARLPFFNVTAGDISPDGNEVLIKTYDQIFYWKRQSGEKLRKLFRRDPLQIPYTPERQGEAIAWSSDGTGFYTFSERRRGPRSHLFFYERNSESQLRRDSLLRAERLRIEKSEQKIDSLKLLKTQQSLDSLQVQDSLRMLDSLRIVDSIRLLDSIKLAETVDSTKSDSLPLPEAKETHDTLISPPKPETNPGPQLNSMDPKESEPSQPKTEDKFKELQLRKSRDSIPKLQSSPKEESIPKLNPPTKQDSLKVKENR